MELPSEMKKQIASRMALLNDMMTTGALNTPIEYLETPVLLVVHMSDDDLFARHKKLMRTRKRAITFGLNGRIYILNRKQAIDVVRMGMQTRGMRANAKAVGLDAVGGQSHTSDGLERG